MNNLKKGTDLPLGFGMALAQNLPAMNHFTTLSREQQQQIVDRAFMAKSKQEMQSLVGSLVPGTDHW